MSVKYKAVFRGGKLFAEYENGVLVYLDPEYVHQPARSELAMPMVIRDIGEYRSPIDGQMITSRNQHRDHMRAHDVVEVGNEKIGGITAARENAAPAVDRDLGMAIKRRIEEVRAMPQAQYDNHVQTQAHEHAEVAALVTATP